MKFSPRSFLIAAFVAANLILLIKLKFFLPQLTGKAQLLDFETYYRLVNDVFNGLNPYTVTYMQTLGPPTVFFFFLPFSFFNLPTAKFLFTAINIFCGLATCYVLSKKLSSQEKSVDMDSRLRGNDKSLIPAGIYFALRKGNYNSAFLQFCKIHKLINCQSILFLILTLLFFSSFPVRFSIEMGQPNLVIGYLVGLLVCYPNNKYMNLLISSIILLKTNYLLVLLSVIKNKQLLIRIIITIFGFMILFPVVKPSFYTYYFTHKTGNFYPPAENSQQTKYYNQSIPARIGVFGLGEYSFFIYLTVLVVFLSLVYRSQNILLGIISSIVLSPTSWQHYYVVLFPIFIFSFVNTKNIKHVILLLIAYILYWIEFPFLHNTQVNIFTAILSSHYLISAIILFVIVYKQHMFSHSASI